jgi:DNA primase
LYSREKIEEVLSATDLVGLVRQYVDLKRAGSSYKGLCPFHAEKTPSFCVTPDKGLYHCFGCGAGGNAINFMRDINKMSFPEAIEALAKRAGVALPKPQFSNYGGEKRVGVSKTDLYAAIKNATFFFQDRLWGPEGREALAYLQSRGLDLDLVRSQGLGLAVNDWRALHNFLKAKGHSDKVLVDAGLIKARGANEKDGYYDVFRNRLMIPIRDLEGREVAFAGRVLPGQEQEDVPKYINSPGTTIYTKGSLLYGFHQARSYLRAAGLVFLVEGYFDYLALVQAKIPNVVAAMGTALTQDQINLLRGQVKEVYLLFDGDKAGQKAASRALPALLNVELPGKVIVLPNDEDPDAFIRARGVPAFYAVAETAMDILDYYVQGLIPEDKPTITSEARAIREAKEMLRLVPDAALSQLLRRKLADKLQLEPNVLSEAPAPERRPVLSAPTKATVPSPRIDPTAKSILAQVVTYPNLARSLPALGPYWPNDPSREVYLALNQQYLNEGSIQPEKIFLPDNEELTGLIAKAAFAAPTQTAEESTLELRQLAENMRSKALKAQHQSISLAMEEAEKAGDTETLKRLAEEKARTPHPLLAKMKPQ